MITSMAVMHGIFMQESTTWLFTLFSYNKLNTYLSKLLYINCEMKKNCISIDDIMLTVHLFCTSCSYDNNSNINTHKCPTQIKSIHWM